MKKVLSCTLVLVMAVAFGACDGGGGGDSCTSHQECQTAYDMNWYCNPLTFKCECLPTALCGGTCCAEGTTCNTATNTCEGACVPNCGTRECGMDPVCGTQSCGTCTGGETCNTTTGMCEACVPSCGTRECGMDPVCGTLSCGTCTPPETCNNNTGMCQGACTPDCGTRECGFDPVCGTQSCGTCTPPETCNVATGMCEGGCTPDCGTRECGMDPVCGTLSCGTCTGGETCNVNTGMCESCTPDCGTRECGPVPNGCGTSCGTCTGGEVCNASGMCEAAGTGVAGDPCPFDTVNATSPNCGANLTCLGMAPDATNAPCATDADCGQFMPDNYNADCQAGGCGASFCAAPCTGGTCPTGFEPATISGQCFCIPSNAGDGQAGDPCTFDTVNPDAGNCASGLTCLGMAPDATNAPCATDADCSQFMPDNYNADCQAGGCGASFCSAPCNAGACETGFEPATISGQCFCIPSNAGSGQAGDPCTFDTVNVNAGNCASGLTCLGLAPDPTNSPCPNGVADCADYLPDNYNPDCVGGGCGASFCSEPCNAGACDTGFDPVTVSGQCFCIPGAPTGDSQPGDPCPWDNVNASASACASGLACLGNYTATDTCATDQACVDMGYPDYYNADCADGGCGFSFCSAQCVGGACDAGFEPVDVSGTCYCVPAAPTGNAQAGDPCPFGSVNSTADLCMSGLACLGMAADPETSPCAVDNDCTQLTEPIPAYWNPDCVGGGCGASFCSAPCEAGACPTGFDPIDVSGTCYCAPNS